MDTLGARTLPRLLHCDHDDACPGLARIWGGGFGVGLDLAFGVLIPLSFPLSQDRPPQKSPILPRYNPNML